MVNALRDDIEKEVLQRLVAVEEKTKSNVHRLNNLEEDKEILHKMQTLLEVSVGTQKELVNNIKEMNINQTKFDQQLQNFDKTLSNVNDNLSTLNSNQQNIQREIHVIKSEVNDSQENLKKVEELANKNKDKGKFDMVNFISHEVPKIVFVALIGAVLAYIGWVK